ncbi:DNA translocase FtsK 4TM domain-containing protein [uncultured Planktomarina sp.]|uniref:DNA translocase FtsK n=1 Tax=uncultured Planktomarina sp. TaxID=1538529 RepID=UPI003261D0DA
MAYPTRGRDPLLDASTQAFLERRGVEALGLVILAVGVMFALALASYSPEDSAWIASGGREIANWAGQIGATISAPLIKIMGLGSWGIPIAFVVWGLRLITHMGAERMLMRLIYAPIFWALCSLYAATLNPISSWAHSFSMGGLFGDTVLFMLLQILPGSAALGANIVALILGALVLLLGGYVTGLVFGEIKTSFRAINLAGSRFLMFVLSLLSSGVSRGAQGLRTRQENRAQLQHEPNFNPVSRSEAARVASVIRANPAMPTTSAALPLPVEPWVSKSLFARVPSMLKRTPELNAKPQLQANTKGTSEDPFEDRIRGKITDAIRSRDPQAALTAQGQTPIVTAKPGRPMGPVPMVLQHPVSEAPFMEDDTDILDDEYLADSEIQIPSYAVDPPLTVQPKQVVQHALKRPIQPSAQAIAEAQPKLEFEPSGSEKTYEKPPLRLLMSPSSIERHVLSDDALEANARMLESVLDDYGVKGEIVSVRPGPVVTMYELEPAPGLKASRVIGLSDDIARSMSALSARVSTVPGRSVIGIELPNEHREMCALREILSAREFGDANMRLPLALGKDIGGEPIVANLAKMPHLLIAGTTGSGKSVAINTMILSLLYRLTPDECRMIMIDPKMLELSVYDGIPHLLSPVVTDPKKAVVALKWTVGEMEDRYRKMSKMGVRNIDGYNSRVKDALSKGEMFSRTVQTGFDDGTGEPLFETEKFDPETLPYIVVIVDEMADLMMVAGKEIEACIQRLAQMARASGIHIIMATQRPSVDVITGTIKANFPTRISFQVTSKVDSRTILGEMGAEQLLGMGDMLYMAGGGKITRVHGPFCSDEEVEDVVNHLKTFGPPTYLSGVVEGSIDDKESDIDAILGLGGNTDMEDALYDTAVQIVAKDRKCSTSYIQRKLAIGYNKAARLVEQMEDNGLVSAANHVGKREILMPEQN